MTKRHWRELVEIVGVVGIVAAVLILAGQIRQSNKIAAAETEIQLAETYNLLHVEQASNPNFAKLFPKLEAPAAHLTTTTEAAQIRGIAWHYVTHLRSVSDAYENGLISRKARNEYIADFTDNFERWPGIRSHYVAIYTETEALQGLEVFAPIAEYIAAQAPTEVD